MKPMARWWLLGATVLVLGCGGAGTPDPEPVQIAADAGAPDPADPSEGMVELVVESVEPSVGGMRLLLVERGEQERKVPMLIGDAEAAAIQMRLSRQSYSRPLTHDLLETLLEELGASVVKLEIDDLRDGVFLARLFVIDRDGELLSLDVRPSDGVTLAVGCDAPIYIAEPVIEQATRDVPAQWPPDSMPPELVEALEALLSGQEIEEAPPPPPQLKIEPGQSLSGEILAQVYSCWFESPYGYMFDRESDESLSIHGASYTRFMGGVRGVLYYGDLSPCLGRLVDVEQKGYDDNDPIAAAAGMSIYGEEMNDDQPFGFYNPELVKWGHENLIPDPELGVAGLTARSIYAVVFSRFFRLMAESRLWLIDKRKLKKEMKAYWKMAMDQKDLGGDGLFWLQKRYRGKLPEYRVDWDGTSMTPQMAIGFWLRRGLDGTDEELWIGLKKVLTAYDAEFFASLKKKYKSKKIEWQTPG
jgi:bifunctional DNase/RNase